MNKGIDHSLDPMWDKLKVAGKKLGLDYEGEKPPVLSDEDVIIPPKSKRRLQVFTEPLVKERIHQARQDTAREIIEEIEKKWGWVSDKLDKIVIDDYGYWGRENSLKDWQSLKSKYLEAHNSQSGIIRL